MFAISYGSPGFNLFWPHVLTWGVIISLLSSFASNLWNHANDLVEDRAQCKITVLTQDQLSQKSAIILSSILYALSGMIYYYYFIRVGRPIHYFFLLWLIITWWYSDNIFLKKIFGFRLKTHYIGELLTYGIAYPAYTVSIWLIYSELNISIIALAVSFSFFGLSGVLLKDLKDISGDRKAGLRTLGVIFSPSKLLYISCFFLILYYFVILNFIVLGVFDKGMLLVIIPFIWFIRNTFYYFQKKSWKIEIRDIGSIRTMVISTYFSLVVLGIGALI